MKRVLKRRWAWVLLSGWALVAVPQGAVAGLSTTEVELLHEKAAQGEPVSLARLREAAEQGDAAAQLSLGWVYNECRGVPPDDAEAVRWFRKSAEQGYADAQFALGLMYEYGRGVPQDDTQAAKWIHMAAEQGNASAVFNELMAKLERRNTAKQGNTGEQSSPVQVNSTSFTSICTGRCDLTDFSGSVRVMVIATGGVVKLTAITGLTAVTGHSQTDWTSGIASEIAFIASQTDANAALDGLQYKRNADKETAAVTIDASNQEDHPPTSGGSHVESYRRISLQ